MKRRLRTMLVLIAVITVVPAPAEAGSLRQLMRFLGLGWSDGYRAEQCDCPTCLARAHDFRR